MSDLFPEAPKAVSLERQIEAVDREVKMRRHVYARRVAEGKMTQAKADTEIAVMEAVEATLRGLAAGKAVG